MTTTVRFSRPRTAFPALVSCIVSVLLFDAGCQERVPTDAIWYGNASLYDGKQLSFTMVIKDSPEGRQAYFLVGDERTEIPEVHVGPDSIVVRIQEYNAAMRLAWDGNGLRGAYERYRDDTTGFPLVASLTRPETPHPGPPSIALAGSFRVFAGAADKPDTSSSAVFWVRNDSAFGTIVSPSGDDGLYAGIQRGDTVIVGRFNGWQALSIELFRDGEEWIGVRYTRQLAPDTVRLVPRPGALPAVDPDRRARLKDPNKPFAFSGVTVEGDTLTHLSPRFRGKPMIVDIMGTWCHNCLDSAPVLESILKEFGPHALEVVSLSFELVDDLEMAQKNMSIFRKRHGLSSAMLFCGDLSAANVGQRIHSQLENFGGYPTALFIDAAGRVVDIHTGFMGPGTGTSYQAEIAYMRDMAKKIISTQAE